MTSNQDLMLLKVEVRKIAARAMRRKREEHQDHKPITRRTSTKTMQLPPPPSPSLVGTLPLVFVILSILHSSNVFVSSFVVGGSALKVRSAAYVQPLRHIYRRASVSETDGKVDRLLELVDADNVELDGKEIRTIVVSLKDEFSPTGTNFTSLLGNYNVTHVIPSKPDEKPVGGKWSRGPAQLLLKTRWTLQHLLAPKAANSVAEAVNIISLSALRDSFRIHVILRGDAYALSDKERADIIEERQTPGGLSSRTVRADFDPPRIVFARKDSSLLNLSVGPPSSVVLDTPYCDDRIRIGKGSRGSWFVFKRCYDDEADEWIKWVAESPVGKSRALGILAGCFGIGLVGCNVKGVWRVGGAVLLTMSLLVGVMIGVSSGGIERDDDEETHTD